MANEKNAEQRVLDPVRPFGDFQEASKAVLEILHGRLGLGLWLITRTEGEDWIVLASEDHGYGVESGDLFRWSDSFCSRMVRGEGPMIAPQSAEVPAYVEAPIGRQVPIGAYIGVPLTRGDGSLFGTLCAIDPSPQPRSIRRDLPTIELHAKLLSTILDAELEQQDRQRRLERAEAESQTDPLTGLYNRRGWTRLLEAEEQRCERYGHPAGVLMLDVDGLKAVNDREGHAAGDQLLRAMAEALQTTVRQSDVVARLGGDEFAVLAVETNAKHLERLARRIRKAFPSAGVHASIGWASREPKLGLNHAQKLADHRMYRRKARAKGRASPRSA